ncbi:MAG: endonuclease III [Rickettsiales bacterium]|nr:endonuclease III [Rickettsiales bacterium]
MKKIEINSLFEIFSSLEPAPVTELRAPNEFCLLVAIVLSAQATDVGVNKATPALFAVADTPQKMLALGEAGIRNHIKTIGLFNAKAKNIWLLSQQLIERHEGRVPEDLPALQALAGVGSKTARVWLNCARGMPLIAVDTHVFRVANRLGLVNTTSANETQTKLEARVPAAFKQHAHHWLILHGRYVCKARTPECWRCPVVGICKFSQKVIAPFK